MTADIEKRKKILCLVPAQTASGGIKNYFQTLEGRFSYNVEYFLRGARTWPYKKGTVRELLRIISDIFRFVFVLITKKIRLVQTSTSFDGLSVLRDGVFILIAKLFRKKVIVFYRGWKLDFERKLEKKNQKLFKIVFFKADVSIVLSTHAKQKLNEWGYKKPVFLETTVVDEELIKNVSIATISEKYTEYGQPFNLLFLARTEKPKGVYETLETYVVLKEQFAQLKLTIAGDGFELDRLKAMVKEKAIPDVDFTGPVFNDAKIKAFTNAHAYIFPSYTEGMPTSVLEAMAFGLPVITRYVGGLGDFFINEKHGYITDSLDPEVFAGFIKILIQDKQKHLEISLDNYRYALSNFTSSKVLERLENIYFMTLNNKFNKQ